MGGLRSILLQRNGGGVGLRESGENGRTGRRGGKGNCSQNVIDKREKSAK